MLNTQLSSCANLLYHWVLMRDSQNEGIFFDLEAFQAWTGEFLLKSATENEILDAISNLKHLNLIYLDGKLIRINRENDALEKYINPLPEVFLDYRKLNKKNYWRWGFLVAGSLCLLWSGCMWLAVKVAELSPSSVIAPTPFSVLAETD